MTAPFDGDTAHELVRRYAGSDRSAAFALHAILTGAGDDGFAGLTDVAIRFRDDYLESLRRRGLDATQEQGRLSLDEVRSFLENSVLPRLAGQGLVRFPVVAAGSAEPGLVVDPDVWRRVAATRHELAEQFRSQGDAPKRLGWMTALDKSLGRETFDRLLADWRQISDAIPPGLKQLIGKARDGAPASILALQLDAIETKERQSLVSDGGGQLFCLKTLPGQHTGANSIHPVSHVFEEFGHRVCDDVERPARRTLVLRREADGLKIVHLHASTQ